MHSSEEDAKIVLAPRVALEGAVVAAQRMCTNECLSQERGSPGVSQWHPPTEVVEEAVVSTCELHLVSKTQG